MKKLCLLFTAVWLLLLVGCAKPALKPSDIQVSPDAGIVLWSDGTYNAQSDNNSFHITNKTRQQVTYGREYHLEQLIDDQWMVIPFKKKVNFEQEVIVLEPGATNQESFFQNLDHDYTFEEGHYRILKQVTLDDGQQLWLADEFDMLPPYKP